MTDSAQLNPVLAPIGPSRANRASKFLPLAVFLGPLTLLLMLGFLWPLFHVFFNSFHPNTPQGVDTARWTIANYTRLANSHVFDLLVRTVRISLAVTVISALLAYPVALFVARQSPRLQSWLILAYLAPWLVNPVVKALGWTIILRNNGVINSILLGLDIVSSPLRLLLSEAGVVMALIPGHFIFVLLPLWTAVSSLDPSMRWAAGTLGATPAATFRRVVLPLTLPSLIVGLTINFIMNMTAFAIPMLLGGVRNEVASMLAYQVNLVLLDWPLGGALAVVLLTFTLFLTWAGRRLAQIGLGRRANAP